jgi:hypothetical protein
MRIDTFVTAMSKYQPLNTVRWNIFIARPGANNRRFNLMVRDVTLPGKELTTVDVQHYGPRRAIANRQTYGEELEMTFMVGKDGYESDYFGNWMDQVVDPITNNPNYYENYVADLGVQQYDKQNTLRYAWKFYEVYPYSIGTTELKQEADGEALILTTTVKFKYRKFNWSGVFDNLESDPFTPNDGAPGDTTGGGTSGLPQP